MPVKLIDAEKVMIWVIVRLSTNMAEGPKEDEKVMRRVTNMIRLETQERT